MDSRDDRPKSNGPSIGGEEEGERARIWEIVLSFVPALARTIGHKLKPGEELDEALNETLVRVMDRLDKPHEPQTYESLRKLAFSRGKYVLGDLVRERQAEAYHVELEDADERGPPDEQPDAQEQLEREELLGIAEGSIANLAGQQKMAVRLDLEDKTNEEIGEEMDVSENTVKKHKQRGWSKVREDVRKGGWDPPTKGSSSKAREKDKGKDNPTQPGEDDD